ncbi:putative transcription factor p65 homolog [Uloborus diversus]|uniref:putative transcription factor p65 homolog n=1 Tax=Uloborus diversus TaxID=327109 RepID=UPI00240A7E67|nr:putative transcription factor p65 homolog [Uloborus diversus]
MIRPDLTASTSAVQQFAFDSNKDLVGQIQERNLQSRFQHSNPKNVYIKIVEQPVRLLKYRYKSDFSKRSPGSIYGENSCAQRTTYPTIQVINCDIPFVVIVSCVTKDVYRVENRKGYLAHPHNLIGINCKNGFCSLQSESDIVSFSNIVIERVKEDEIAASLETRRKFRIDPYGMGFNHRENIDLRVVRLCFQIYIKGQTDIYARTVSEPIYNKDVVSDLKIAYLSSDNAPVEGSEDFIILCPRVNEGAEVWFFEECQSQITWAKQATVKCIYKKVAVMCNVPPYFRPDATKTVDVFVHLRNPVEDIVGEKRPFRYIARRGARSSSFSSTFEFDPFYQRDFEGHAFFVPRTMEKFSLQEQNDPSASSGSLREKSPEDASSVPKAFLNTTGGNLHDWWHRYNFLQEQLKAIKQELNLMESSYKSSSEEKNLEFTNEDQQQFTTKNQNTDELAEDVLNFFENLSTDDIIVDESHSTENLERNVPPFLNNLSNIIVDERQSTKNVERNVPFPLNNFSNIIVDERQSTENLKRDVPFSLNNLSGITVDERESSENLEPNVPNSSNDLYRNQIGHSNEFSSNFQSTEHRSCEPTIVPSMDAIKERNLSVPLTMSIPFFLVNREESMELEGIPQNISESMYPSS